MTDVSGAVLAGGASRRMGRDKRLITLGGQTLLSIVVARLAGVCTDLMVVGGPTADLPPGSRHVPDDRPGQGPLAGILTALRAASQPLVAVVGVDMPSCDPGLLAWLSTRQPAVAAAPLVDGIIHPLHAVYATAAHDRLAELFAAGERSPRRALELLDADLVPEEEWAPVTEGRPFWTSLDRPSEVAAHEQAMAEERFRGGRG